jgi:hypothetical protein
MNLNKNGKRNWEKRILLNILKALLINIKPVTLITGFQLINTLKISQMEY